MRYTLLIPAVLACFSFAHPKLWGFFGHRKISQMAIYTLPPAMMQFYKQNADILIEKSIAPDQRRYVIAAEGPRHYIDLDEFEQPDSLPKYWFKAVEKYGEKTLMDRGIVPWHAFLAYKQLVRAFAARDKTGIINRSADLSHYLADANVPLHTTSNYNGQQTGQTGIHGFWETRLPQLFSDEYDFLVGKAAYIDDPQAAIWQTVRQAYDLVDSVLLVERQVTGMVGESKKFAFEDKGRRAVKVYAKQFSRAYHTAMPAVERQMQRSIKMVGDFWFTAWVEAGQPDLSGLDRVKTNNADSLPKAPAITPARLHEH